MTRGWRRSCRRSSGLPGSPRGLRTTGTGGTGSRRRQQSVAMACASSSRGCPWSPAVCAPPGRRHGPGFPLQREAVGGYGSERRSETWSAAAAGAAAGRPRTTRCGPATCQSCRLHDWAAAGGTTAGRTTGSACRRSGGPRSPGETADVTCACRFAGGSGTISEGAIVRSVLSGADCVDGGDGEGHASRRVHDRGAGEQTTGLLTCTSFSLRETRCTMSRRAALSGLGLAL